MRCQSGILVQVRGHGGRGLSIRPTLADELHHAKRAYAQRGQSGHGRRVSRLQPPGQTREHLLEMANARY